VRRLLEDLKERHSLSVKLLLFGSERRYSRTLELAVFRIIQEAVNNVQKHAESSGATVKLELHPQQVLAVIQDDGKGFDPEMAMENKEHYGLLNMRERAQGKGHYKNQNSCKQAGDTCPQSRKSLVSSIQDNPSCSSWENYFVVDLSLPQVSDQADQDYDKKNKIRQECNHRPSPAINKLHNPTSHFILLTSNLPLPTSQPADIYLLSANFICCSH
jgi:hypothetical protein